MLPDSAGLELAAARWLLYLAAFVLIGAAGARFVIARTHDPAIDAARRDLLRAVARVRVGGSIVLALAAIAMLVAQVHSWFGPGFFVHADDIRITLTETPWGRGWVSVAQTAVAVLVITLLAAFVPRDNGLAGLVAAIGAAMAVPLTGHGSAGGATVWWTHAAHVFGGSLWLGTLAVLLPVTWRYWTSPGTAAAPLRALLARFSPVALFGAAVAVLSGTALIADHVPSMVAMTSTAYGRTLILKVGVIAVAAGLGWMNWRAADAIDDARARRALRTRAIAEATVAALAVLGATAVLAGLSPDG